MLFRIRFCIVWITVIMGFLFVVVGCKMTGMDNTHERGSGSTDTLVIAPVTSHPDPLDGTQWELIAFEERGSMLSIPVEPQPVIEFDGGTLRLVTGCNDPGGHYVIEDDKIMVTFSRVTTMDCTDVLGVDVMAVESVFSTAMPTFESYAIEENMLHIFYPDGELLFRRESN